MHIVYIAHYAGPLAVERRFSGVQPSLAGSKKIELIARALLMQSHTVTILSPGVYCGSGRFFSTSFECLNFPEGQVEVRYSPFLDRRILHRFVSCTVLKSALHALHRQRTVERVLIYNIGETMLAATRAAAELRIPVVLEYEDDAFMDRRGRMTESFYRLLDQWAIPIYYQRIATAIIRQISGALVVCPELGRELQTKNIAVVRGVLDEDILQGVPSEITGTLRPFAELLYSGSHSFDKGIDLLLEALAFVEHPVRLRLLGGVAFEGVLKKKLRCVPNRHRVQVLGYLPRREYVSHLYRSHLLINPHRVGIGNGSAGALFPFKIVEYAATGCPIVSSPLSELDGALRDYAIAYYKNDDARALAAQIDEVLLNYDCWRAAAMSSYLKVRQNYGLRELAPQIGRIFDLAASP